MRRDGAGRWIIVYGALVLLPLLLAAIRPAPPGRTFWTEFGVGLGFVGLAMLWLQFALTARFRNIAASLGMDTMLQFHGQAGVYAIMFALAHPAVLIASEPSYVEFFDPRVSAVRALALYALIGALVLLLVLTFKRQPLGIPYEWWRATHGVLGLGVVFLGTVHVLRVGYYISVPWKQAVWVAATMAAIWLLFHTRVVRPLRLRKRPWRVIEVRPERGSAWTIALEPQGHPGLSFTPGQFAWLTLGDSPFSLQEHPFSFSSSARQTPRVEMTIKALGDYTARVGGTPPGGPAFLEGPFGAFAFPDDAPGGVFIAGGVGITPLMSILRTMRDNSDRRPIVLIYGTSTLERTLFVEELEQLQREMQLQVVHVLEAPPEGWQGDRGWLSREIIERHLPDAATGYHALICGPDPMMDIAEDALRKNDVPLARMRSERFNIV